MKHYILKSSTTNIMDTSSISERGRIQGDTEFLLLAWDDDVKRQIFETSEASVKFSRLPIELQQLWSNFEKHLIAHILASVKTTEVKGC